MKNFSFPRPFLASQYCAALAGDGIIDAKSGLFLTAPRRVGKSTFLREDLIPEATRIGWLTVYVDLWSDKMADPARLIAGAIKTALSEYAGIISKTAKSVGLTKISIGGFQLDITEAGLPKNVTLTDALAKLHELAGKPIVLIVDEAQQALKTEAGINTMFALKAARDQLNRSNEKPKLMLVFTGSHRDKLAHLVLKRDQPFFGSSITSFPLLGHDFIKAFTLWVNAHLSSNNLFNEESVGEAFKLVGHKPEMLRSLIGSVAISGEANNLSGVLNEKAVEFHDMIWEDISSNYSGLNVMQKAILQVMIAKRGSSYPPFSAESISEYKRITGEKEISTTTVQTMIESLRDKGFIWNPSRGSYALEDDGFAEWYLRTQVIEVPEK